MLQQLMLIKGIGREAAEEDGSHAPAGGCQHGIPPKVRQNHEMKLKGAKTEYVCF